MRARFLVPAVLALAGGIAVVPLAQGASAASSVTAGSVPPDQDPFYAAPANIDTYQPGQIVASRPSPISVSGVKATAAQISYRSNDSHNAAILAVTTIVVPGTTWTGKGARPVVSMQEPEDSVGLKCSPSYAYASGAGEPLDSLAALLGKGWAVAIPDFEGPKSVFLAGPEAGHAILDGIRAVKQFNTLGIGATNPWALTGYSGGAEATGWAAQLQPSYAPDVKLLGTAVGGLPADPTAVARSIDGGIFSGFEYAVSYSLAVEFPESGITGLLNDRGRADFADASKGLCLTDILSKYAFRKLSDDVTVADPLTVPSVAAVLKLDTLGATAPVSSNPIYDYHAIPDEIVPLAQDDALVKNWCKGGAVIQTHRDLFAEHALEAVVQQTDMVNFLAARFAGSKPTNNC
ncbi:secretory lipase [Jatrophihabitans sp. GAS493]|uniref:lipase family protein n=1 Tax=Jatrophihabitans sp. GAS493 TaxID=1907575 RepID=UPI000BB87EFA|nr:lipase family protein [Jatrophihabitans sp. GAS493]SOD74583.1 secretory lipase [Jatrophihabitans sp. GAS493]